MRQSLSVVVLTTALAACANDSTGPTVATLSGTIAARSFTGASQTHLGWILVAAGSACEQQIAFGIASDTRLVRFDGTPVTTDSLAIGRIVSVEYRGFGAMSCPAQFGADVVTLKPST